MVEGVIREPRIESGSIVFGSDWPGLFLRGDDAFHFSLHLQNVLDCVETLRSDGSVRSEFPVLSLHVLQGLLHDLKSVIVTDEPMQRQQLKTARECLASSFTLPGPGTGPDEGLKEI